MGVASIGEIAARLVSHGLGSETPVLMVASATTPREERRLSSLAAIGRDAAGHPADAPALFIIGEVVSLYSAAQDAAERERLIELALANHG